MNWFERYGIVGMFFIVMAALWYFCLFPQGWELLNKGNVLFPKYVIGLCALSFLPFGYLIMVFSQLYYYLVNRKNRIHIRYWNDLRNQERDDILNTEKMMGLPEFNQNSEIQVESILAYYGKTRIDRLENNKFLSKFATKRFDAVAINEGLIWATFFSLITAICLEGITFGATINWGIFSTWFVFILALSIVSVLFVSEQVLQRQIFEIGRRKARIKKNKEK